MKMTSPSSMSPMIEVMATRSSLNRCLAADATSGPSRRAKVAAGLAVGLKLDLLAVVGEPLQQGR
jgi:hypothetical protein